MKTFLLVPLFFFILHINAQTTAPRCGADQYLQINIANDPELVTRMNAIEAYTLRWMATHKNATSLREIITIPVVIHVVYKEQEHNISIEQIESQLEVLNKDFRQQNIELSNVPNEFTDRIADVEFEFCLASRTPTGQATSGITRTQTNKSSIGDSDEVKLSNQGGQDSWGRDEYLNIWVAKMSSGIFGRATRPGEASAPELDGVVVDPRYFGSTGIVNPPYDLGRTATHEIGHYFNLQHPWGPEDGICSEDDGVSDTPHQEGSYSGCPSHPQQTCSTNDLFMNFMEYVHDSCLMMFTEGQKLRMRSTLAVNGFRQALVNSRGCETVSTTTLLPSNSFSFYPNPVKNDIYINFNNLNHNPIQLEIFNTLGRLIHKEQLQYPRAHHISLPNLIGGVYFIKINTSEGFLVKKLLVQYY